MKLVVTIGYNNCLLFPAEQASTIVGAFSTGTRASESGYGADRQFKPDDDSTIKFEFVSDDLLLEKEEPFKELQKSKAVSEKKWLEEYRLRVEAQNKVKELEARLTSLKTAVTTDSPF